ncbi:M20 family metallopeptidase [Microbispora sp. GKU 823]|uniref:M20 family metallopeptidase n=1 Tax=Microbispora sp. GKU 823 TaxID=1652100 RepID=UPI0021181705|nr:M20/M25/M40 family metallo-hydrolase [Microbispora sp. GKU 823]
MNEAVELARELIRIDSVGGGEAAVAGPLARRLSDAGFAVRAHEHAPGRTGLVARWGTGEPVTLTGHLDTVPLGGQAWRHAPHGAEIDGDRLYGRGSSDMKAGVAALVIAAERHVRRTGPKVALEMVFTVGEETGCEGAAGMVAEGLVGRSRALLVAERPPTGCCSGTRARSGWRPPREARRRTVRCRIWATTRSTSSPA